MDMLCAESGDPEEPKPELVATHPGLRAGRAGGLDPQRWQGLGRLRRPRCPACPGRPACLGVMRSCLLARSPLTDDRRLACCSIPGSFRPSTTRAHSSAALARCTMHHQAQARTHARTHARWPQRPPGPSIRLSLRLDLAFGGPPTLMVRLPTRARSVGSAYLPRRAGWLAPGLLADSNSSQAG